MFNNRWSVAWLGIWFVGALVWAAFLVNAVIERWPRVQPFGINGDIFALPVFLLTWFTLPAFSIFFGVLAIGWGVVRLSRLPFWSFRIDLPSGRVDSKAFHRFWRRLNSPVFPPGFFSRTK